MGLLHRALSSRIESLETCSLFSNQTTNNFLDIDNTSRTTMASKTFLTRKKTEKAEAEGGAGGDISSIGFAPPSSNEAAPGMPSCLRYPLVL